MRWKTKDQRDDLSGSTQPVEPAAWLFLLLNDTQRSLTTPDLLLGHDLHGMNHGFEVQRKTVTDYDAKALAGLNPRGGELRLL